MQAHDTTFFGLSREGVNDIFVLGAYMAKYVSLGAGHPNLREVESMGELQHWSLEVPCCSWQLDHLVLP